MGWAGVVGEGARGEGVEDLRAVLLGFVGRLSWYLKGKPGKSLKVNTGEEGEEAKIDPDSNKFGRAVESFQERIETPRSWNIRRPLKPSSVGSSWRVLTFESLR